MADRRGSKTHLGHISPRTNLQTEDVDMRTPTPHSLRENHDNNPSAAYFPAIKGACARPNSDVKAVSNWNKMCKRKQLLERGTSPDSIENYPTNSESLHNLAVQEERKTKTKPHFLEKIQPPAPTLPEPQGAARQPRQPLRAVTNIVVNKKLVTVILPYLCSSRY